MKKRGQITIFIIVALVLVASVLLFLVFRKTIPEIGVSKDVNIDLFLKTCIEDKIEEGIELIESQGGYTDLSGRPSKIFKFTEESEFTSFSYLCYNQNDYLPCINQEPVLIRHLKDEIKDYISEDVGDCFDGLVSSLDNRQGYEIDKQNYRGFEVGLESDRVIIEIDSELVLTRAGETSKHEDSKIILPSNLYDIASVVQEIVNQEARSCDFEDVGYMLLYPKFSIDKFVTGDSIKIYTVEHKDSKERFRFAVRGCVMPPGL